MGEIGFPKSIKVEQLCSKKYFSSLVEQAYLCNMLSPENILKIKSEMILLLAKQSEKWCKGESSSIPTEKAQDIMTSLTYVIGIALKSCDTPEYAVQKLKSDSLENLLQHGMKIIQRKLVRAKQMHKRIAGSIIDTHNFFYKSTIVDGIAGFFKLYCPDFTAHEIHITVDYPAFLGRPNLDGIEFIEKYLEFIEAENIFCAYFSPEKIHHLMYGVSSNYHSIPVNIFEVVFLSAIGLSIVNRSVTQLNLTENNIHDLHFSFLNKSNAEIQLYLKKYILILDSSMSFPDTLKNYLFLCVPTFTALILNSLSLGKLDKIFIIPVDPNKEIKIMISYGEQMDNKKYLQLVKSIEQVHNEQEKVNLIIDNIKSRADLLDILSDTDLSSQTLEVLVFKLPSEDFVFLLNQFPNDDFLDREADLKLYHALQERVINLSDIEKKQVSYMLKVSKNGDEEDSN
ncbi:DUF6179 domain-containing protein [Enterococcus gallinarum]|uniref:DUF6179 domain-containing protein n=1 Tax=Enterococcus gallinarum TaxID=1353 RepID=UPI0011DE3297|nr:DUF6179 domain-containing protein [Enterococcus gallinarum]TXT68605.1 hypothetical protein D4N12_11230 [Enterococcus gallinarum]